MEVGIKFVEIGSLALMQPMMFHVSEHGDNM